MAKRAVVVLSGGQDSTTCLYWALDQGYEVHAVTFDYGQRHQIEVAAARVIGLYAGVASHEVVELPLGVLKGTSPLVSINPLEQYKDHQSLPGGLEKTFVPMRNQLFLTLAANRAYVLGTNILVTGVSAEDYGGYPDCRLDFINAFENASTLGTFTGEGGAPRKLLVYTPLMTKDKRQTVEMALTLQGCYGALAFSHTSYDGKFPPTGKDHATLLREKGFELADVPDPLWLRAWIQGYVMTLPSKPNYRASRVDEYAPAVIEALDTMKKELDK